jgi:hypothetical protein
VCGLIRRERSGVPGCVRFTHTNLRTIDEVEAKIASKPELTMLRLRTGGPAGFIIPCQPSAAHKPPSGPGWIHDGYRMMGWRAPGRTTNVRFGARSDSTRTSKDLPRLVRRSTGSNADAAGPSPLRVLLVNAKGGVLF